MNGNNKTTPVFRKAGLKDIPAIREIVLITWPETYGPILSQEQLDYMIDLIYSPASLEKQMQEDQQFILLEEDDKPIAFASYSKGDEASVYKLNKLYALPNQQGKGLGKKLISYVIDEILSKKATTLRLNVNRHNKAKSFYEKLGFHVVATEDIDIGNGYFMNDYVLEKSLY